MLWKHISKNLSCVNRRWYHVTEFFKISEEDRHEFIDAVSITANAVMNVFGADKINYATYGDKVNHLHVHVTPKYQDGPDWGGPFSDAREPKRLTEEEYQERVKAIRDAIEALQG